MRRFHDTSNDPLPLFSPQHEAQRAELDQMTAAFFARGGEVEEVGFSMSDSPATFVINPETTPVYAHLFTPSASNAAPPSDHDDMNKHAGLIMADAALGTAPKWIAHKHHMTEKYVRQVARDYHITFHKQR